MTVSLPRVAPAAIGRQACGDVSRLRDPLFGHRSCGARTGGPLLRGFGLWPWMVKLRGGVDRSVQPLATVFQQRQPVTAHLKLTRCDAVSLGMGQVVQLSVMTHLWCLPRGDRGHR